MEFLQGTLETYLDQMRPLVQQNWEELEQYKIPYELNMNWDLYKLMESMDKFVTVVAIDNKILVGYNCYILSLHPHYSNMLCAQSVVLFLLPEYRKGRNAFNLLRESEKILRDKNVNMISAHVRKEINFSPLLTSIGYTELETVYTKVLE
jgi:hypothetical protein